MARSDPHAKVLSFGDVVLRHADVELLQGPHWLNDQVIAFYFEYCAREKYKELQSAILLLPGAISFLLANCSPSEAVLILEPLQVRSKSLILFAVNDNRNVEAAGGGSHWSLLVYFCNACTFRHYDSSTGRSSRSAALRLHRAVHDALAPGGKACPLVHVAEMPQQQNGYDCGVYVLAVADAVCSWAQQAPQHLADGGHVPWVDWSMRDLEAHEGKLRSWLSSQHVAKFRTQVMELILSLEQAQSEGVTKSIRRR